MKKKILWIPQLATNDKQTGKVIINADSNMTTLNGLSTPLSQHYDIDVVMPNEEYCNRKFSEAMNLKCIHYVYQLKKAAFNAFALRYNFDFSEYTDIVKASNPDIVLCHTPSITKNLKAVLFHLHSNAKLANFLHFLDQPGEDKVPLPISYFMRQVEGIIWSDLALFQSYTVRDKALAAIDKYFKKYVDEYNRSIKRKKLNVGIWNATYSQDEIDAVKNDKYPIKTIMFPNRLSSTNYSNHLRFFKAIQNIAKARNDFQVIVNNPTKYLTYEQIADQCPNLKILNNGVLLEKQQYFEALKATDVGVALFVQEGHGGASSKQFQAAGCLPVFPKCNEYAYLMPKNYKGFCKPDLKDLEKALNYALDVCRTPEGDKLVKIAKELIYNRDSFEYNLKNVLASLETIC